MRDMNPEFHGYGCPKDGEPMSLDGNCAHCCKHGWVEHAQGAPCPRCWSGAGQTQAVNGPTLTPEQRQRIEQLRDDYARDVFGMMQMETRTGAVHSYHAADDLDVLLAAHDALLARVQALEHALSDEHRKADDYMMAMLRAEQRITALESVHIPREDRERAVAALVAAADAGNDLACLIAANIAEPWRWRYDRYLSDAYAYACAVDAAHHARLAWRLLRLGPEQP